MEYDGRAFRRYMDIFQQIINQHLIVITTAVIYTVTTTNGPINSGIGTVTIIANYSDAVF
jgi:hypothetical protein